MGARRRVRFGIVGLGLMGREFASAIARWCHLLSDGPIPELVGVCSPHEKSHRWFDAILQMWAAFLQELEGGALPTFGCFTPEETRISHALLSAALDSQRNASVEPVDL